MKLAAMQMAEKNVWDNLLYAHEALIISTDLAIFEGLGISTLELNAPIPIFILSGAP